MLVSGTRLCGRIQRCSVSEERSYLCVWRRLGTTMRRIRNELDWLLSMGLMWQRISKRLKAGYPLLRTCCVMYGV